MPNYIDSGFNDFLLRPLEASYTEQMGIESVSVYNQISGSQVFGDTIFSKNKKIALDLENGILKFSTGATDKLKMGVTSEGDIGLSFFDNDGNEIIKIDNEGLKIYKGKFNYENEYEKNYFNSAGINISNFITSGTKYMTASSIDITGDNLFFNLPELSHNFTTKTPCWGFFSILLQHSSTGFDASLIVRLKVDDKNIPAPIFYTNRNEWTASHNEVDNIELHMDWFNYTQIFEPGSHAFRIEVAGSTPDETIKILGNNSNTSTLFYTLIGRT